MPVAPTRAASVQKGAPTSLPDLQARLQRGFAAREAFCNDVLPLVPKTGGQKGPIAEVVTGIAEPVIQALVTIWSRVRDDDALMRKTIQTQLEATSWPAFDKVVPSS